MERVLIFGNTPESRNKARMLRQRGRQVVMSVTSEYARSLLPPGTMCHVGKLNAESMLAFIREVAPNRIVDATHPYSIMAQENIRHAAEELGLPCEREHFDNIEDAWRDSVEWVDTHEAIIAAIQREKGNMLLGIGRDSILPIPLETDMTRLFPRITPTPEAVAACLELGYPRGNIIAMDGPFSRELTMALFDQKSITGVIVRDATDKGYLHEMVLPALERGIHVVMYGRK